MLAMPQFLNDFGVYNPKTNSFDLPSTWQSAGSGPPIAGLAVGAVIAGMVGNHLGRLKTFRLSSVISIVGILIQCTSVGSYWQIMIGRIINSLALGILANTVPAYLAEVSPLSIRGTLVNCYQFSISIGAILVNTANWGMYQRTDQWAYRLVLILQLTVPVMFVIGSFFVPESPRWLIGKDRRADAGNSLRTLRTDTSPEVVDQEIQLIMAAEEENKSQFDRSWVECFRYVFLS
jgi:MFS family permease